MRPIHSWLLIFGILLAYPTPSMADDAGHSHDVPAQGVTEASKPGEEAGDVVQVKAKGLVCDFCARALEKVIMKRPEVEGMKVDLTSKVIAIRLKKGRSLDDETIKSLVTAAGYNIEAIERP